MIRRAGEGLRTRVVDAAVALALLHVRSGVSEFGDEGGEEVRGGGAGGGERRLQRVHQDHQLPHFRHDPALFGEGWKWNPDEEVWKKNIRRA